MAKMTLDMNECLKKLNDPAVIPPHAYRRNHPFMNWSAA